MVEGLLWVVGLYAISAALAHWAVRRRKSAVRELVLIAGGETARAEWVLRSWLALASWRGDELRITVVNTGADAPETMRIAEQMGRRHPVVSLRESELTEPAKRQLRLRMLSATVLELNDA